MIHDSLRSNLVSHLHELIRERDPYVSSQGHYYARHYIHTQLSQWGTPTQMPFTCRGQVHYNIGLNLPGQSDRAPIVIGAHYDTVPGCPGADDNATGVAVLLELARYFAAQPPQRPVYLVAFDLEEYGLIGSQAYVQTQIDQPIHLMLSLEMLGYRAAKIPERPSQNYPVAALKYIYPTDGDFIALIGNWQLVPTLWRLQQEFRKTGLPCAWLPMVNRGQPIPATRRSDHAPFWDAGYDAILVTDTAELRNPHYHKRTDTFDTLDLKFLTQVCQGLQQGIAQL
ncbi:M28 family peptidase [Leptothoe kymatousa]|uniref:M28 family peptidase n=1 Tax=Leptothoe kymatousa TAU-MAC 1615 TaxID=2364775 RepID=A0ABS5Y876_9CYAN|nr:M28 family peptidase [Leptothoe kymatousa]MBT9313708.1 M28 family peptidase [Leptothoe kymatousa TAU-MAC 1615]